MSDTGVALGELGAEAAEGVVDVGHAVAAGGEREAEGLDVHVVDRAVQRQQVLQALGRGLRQGAVALAAAHHGERHRGDHDGARDDQEQEHNHRCGPHGR
jgi:hypothetical protein